MGKTPMHYLHAHNKSEYLESMNRVFEFILAFLEVEQGNYVFRQTLDALHDMLPVIFTSITPNDKVSQFLEFCFGSPQFYHGQELKSYGETRNRESQSENLVCSHPVILDNEKLHKIYRSDGSKKLAYMSTLMGFDFDLRSNDVVSFLLFLKQEDKRLYFEDGFVSAVLDHIW